MTMQVEYKLKLGQDEFILKAEVKDEKDFFEKMSFYSNLPRVAPGGANDLKLVFRTTKKGHKYYALISESERKEFKLGQNLENNGGGLFPKGWSDAYGQDSEEAPTVNQAPISVGAQPAIQTPKSAQPVVGTPIAKTPAVKEEEKAPAQEAAPAKAPAAQPSQAAVNVLERFGIKK